VSPRFGGSGQERAERSEAEREAARREREERRAGREGRPAPERPATAAGVRASVDEDPGEGDLREDPPLDVAAADGDPAGPRAADPVLEPAFDPELDPAGEPEHTVASVPKPDPVETSDLLSEPAPSSEPAPLGEPTPPLPEREALQGSDAPLEPGAVAEPDTLADPEPEPGAEPHEAPAPVVRSEAAPPQVVAPPPQAVPPPPRQVPTPPARPRPLEAPAAGAGDDTPIGVRKVSAADAVRAQGATAAKKGRIGTPGVPRVPGQRRGVRRFWALAVFLVIAAIAWVVVSLYQPLKGDGDQPVSVRIPPGSSAGQIGELLAAQDVVSSKTFFSLRARLEGGTLKSGTFRLRHGMSYAAAIEALSQTAPPPKTIRVTLPEGLSRKETAKTIKAAGLTGDYLEASKRSSALNPRSYGAPRRTPSLEGFLFPATYELKPGAAASRLVRDQLTAFRRTFGRLNLAGAKRRQLTRYDIVIIASMIEREASIDKDRPLISAVIQNRLKQGIPLGIDATIRYDLDNFSRPLRVSELKRDTPFNTRTRQGLPPTPIGNPGLASLKAAARPAKVGFLYYVVKPCGNGTHTFSSTDAAFQRDVAAYNAARDKRGGKDPSRC